MGVFGGPADWWTDTTSAGRNHMATNGTVTRGLQLNLDAGATISYPGSGTTWTDVSGQNNTCTLTASVTYITTGTGGPVLNFPGGGDQGEIVTTSGLSSSTAVTLEFVMYSVSSIPGTGNILLKNGNSGWRIRTETNLLNLITNGGSLGLKTTAGSISINSWCYVAATMSSTTGCKIYLNGNLNASTPTNYSPTAIATGNVYISQWPGTGETWYGRLGIVRIYNSTLTAAEVSLNFNRIRGRFGL